MSSHNSDYANFWLPALVQHKGKIIDADQKSTCSYQELNSRIEAFACKINQKRQLVALVANNSLTFVIAYLALLRYQHTILVLEDEITDTSSADLLSLVSSKNQSLLTQYQVNYLVLAEQCQQLNPEPICLHNELALLLSTSGSTGSSKLVKLSYKNLQANTHSICSYLPIKASDTAVTTLPLHYSFGLSLLHTHLALGSTIIFTNASPLEKQLWDIYKHYQPQSFYGVPFSFELLNKLQLKRLPLNSIKYFAQAGGKLPLELGQELSQWCNEHQKQLFIMYGQTEATARIAYLSPDKLPAKKGSIGKAIPYGKLRLIDECQNEIKAPNINGELYYQGDNIFIGYAKTLACLAIADDITWLKTGDIASFDSEGDFQITGRSKRIIKVLGKRISLDETEQYLSEQCNSHSSQNIAVSGQDDQLTVHIVQPHIAQSDLENETTDENESHVLDTEHNLYELAAEYTQINKRYIKVKTLKEMPRLSNGKIAYEQLNNG